MLLSVKEFLLGLDWIGPTEAAAAAEILYHGPFRGHTFYVGLDSGYTGAFCKRLLIDKGITCYARRIANGDAFLAVPTEQAAYAEWLLLSEGVPLKYHLYHEVRKDQPWAPVYCSCGEKNYRSYKPCRRCGASLA